MYVSFDLPFSLYLVIIVFFADLLLAFFAALRLTQHLFRIFVSIPIDEVEEMPERSMKGSAVNK